MTAVVMSIPAPAPRRAVARDTSKMDCARCVYKVPNKKVIKAAAEAQLRARDVHRLTLFFVTFKTLNLLFRCRKFWSRLYTLPCGIAIDIPSKYTVASQDGDGLQRQLLATRRTLHRHSTSYFTHLLPDMNSNFPSVSINSMLMYRCRSKLTTKIEMHMLIGYDCYVFKNPRNAVRTKLTLECKLTNIYFHFSCCYCCCC